MVLRELTILNYKNIQEAHLLFSHKLNCFVGLNGQGKTNILDAIYMLSFTKSAFNTIDSQNINHHSDMAMIQGEYITSSLGETTRVTCGLKRGQKKQFRLDNKDYKRMVDHIGYIPLVLISPEELKFIDGGSDERRRFIDGVISQYSKKYLEDITQYNALLKQRNALLKQYEEQVDVPWDFIDILDDQLVPLAYAIYQERSAFIERFIPIFQSIYTHISGGNESVNLSYVSQLHERDLKESLQRTHQRDLILGWTSQGIHKDDIDMSLEGYPLKRVGSQGQQKTYLLSLKLAQALYLVRVEKNALSNKRPILLLDDIFDKLDSERVERIIQLVQQDEFGQIFITDTDRQHLTTLLQNMEDTSSIFHVSNGVIS